MNHEWALVPFLIVLANSFLASYVYKAIGLNILKLIGKTLEHFNIINIDMTVQKIRALLVTMGVSDANLVASEKV